MTLIRQPAVAGQFYPGSTRELISAVDRYLAKAKPGNGEIPKAIIAPHAGFVYSGPVAATAYARLKPLKDVINKVILLGPCHRVAVKGLALPSSDAFLTPLGNIAIDNILRNRALHFPQVQIFDPTHIKEHSLEVHLPFLQRVLTDFTLLPIIVGQTPPESIAEVINDLWGGQETLIVVSSDLSHYLDYESACEIDIKTSKAIENLTPDKIARDGACGRFPIRGLLVAAKARGMTVRTVDLRNSGDTAGPKEKVVGYGSWVFFENKDSCDSKRSNVNETLHDKISHTSPENVGFAIDKTENVSTSTKKLLETHGLILLRIATASIKYGFQHQQPAPVNLDQFPIEFGQPWASFVTLTKDTKLRGCIGSLEAYRSLATDISANAFRAAFKDPRFSPLSSEEFEAIELSISLLSAHTLMEFDTEREFMEQLRPCIDGLIIAEGQNRALFLPSVWDQLPDPAIFVERLKQKAGLPKNHWSKGLRAWRFVTETISSQDL